MGDEVLELIDVLAREFTAVASTGLAKVCATWRAMERRRNLAFTILI